MSGVTTTTQQRSTDPSAALVERIAAEALNPGYAQRAGARQPSGHRRAGAVLTVVMLALVGLLVSVLVVSARQGAASVDSERSSLVALAQEAQAEVAA